MHKIDADRLAIIAYGTEEEPSDNIHKLGNIFNDIRYRLERGGYETWVEEHGEPCWILQPGEQWKRGKLKISFEVYIDDSPIKTDENTSPLDDLRNLNDEQP